MMPNNIDVYYDQAKKFIMQICKKVPLNSAILDDWRGLRIVYGGPCVQNCQSKCTQCSLFEETGEDSPDIKQVSFRKTLYPATENDIETFSSHQKYLNCKTFEQYLKAYIEYILKQCNSEDQIKEELNLVKGFRILFLDNVDDLVLEEKKSKKYIVEECLKRIDRQRKRILSNYAFEIGLIDYPTYKGEQDI